MKRAAAVLAVLAWAPGAAAQVAPPAPESIPVGDWRLTPVAEVRTYGEYRHDLDAQDRGAIAERVRLGAGAERGPVEARVVLEDARLWDAPAGSTGVGQPNELGLTTASEGWVEAHTVGARPSYARIGRQAVTWGEGRLLGASPLSPTGRWLDAARARLVLGPWAFEALGASLSDPVPPTGATVAPAYGQLAGARVEWGLVPLFAVDLYGLARFAQLNPAQGLEGTVAGDTYTGALRLHGEGDGWSWGAEGALQGGTVNALDRHRAAWAAAGHVAYTFDRAAWTPQVGLGAAYASGDRGTGAYQGFDPLLPDARTFHGAMDVFSWSNEEEASARVAARPWTDGLAAVEYRYARLAEASGAWRSDYLVTIAGGVPGASADLGHEIDASLRWSPWVPVELSAGYSVLLLGQGAKDLLLAARETDASAAHLGWATVRVRVP